MVRYITNQKAEIDIHNMLRAEAKKYLEQSYQRQTEA